MLHTCGVTIIKQLPIQALNHTAAIEHLAQQECTGITTGFCSLSCTETDKLQAGFQLGSVSPMASGPL
jgi:hypothetical protein